MKKHAEDQCRVHLSSNGRVNIPSRFRKAMGIKDGDELILTLEDNMIQLQPLDQIVTEIQDLAAKYFAEDDLMDDLRKMRSADFLREQKKIENN